MTLALLALGFCAFVLWYTFDYLPECERREGLCILLMHSIEICFDEVAPGDHSGIGEECWFSHECREDDDLNALGGGALRWAQGVGDAVGPRHRLHWAVRPKFHICNDHGIRKTCLVCRFFLRPLHEDPHA